MSLVIGGGALARGISPIWREFTPGQLNIVKCFHF